MITTVQAVIFLAYIFFIAKKYGEIPHSISDSWYFLSKKERWLFTAFCWSIGLLMPFQGETDWFIISGAGLCFVGAAVEYKTVVPYIHYIGATVCIVFAFLGLLFEFGMVYPLAIFALISAIHGLFGNKPIWWIEIYAFVIIIASFLLR